MYAPPPLVPGPPLSAAVPLPRFSAPSGDSSSSKSHVVQTSTHCLSAHLDTQHDSVDSGDDDLESLPASLLVAYFPRSATTEDLRSAFISFGRILHARVVKDKSGASKCYGFINFELVSEARGALEACSIGQVVITEADTGKEWRLTADWARKRSAGRLSRRRGRRKKPSGDASFTVAGGASDQPPVDFAASSTSSTYTGSLPGGSDRAAGSSNGAGPATAPCAMRSLHGDVPSSPRALWPPTGTVAQPTLRSVQTSNGAAEVWMFTL